jgi:MYXO-CTERM domain-containing protein
MARDNQGAFTLLDEQEAMADHTALAHELGHALGLKHGHGTDNDCDGRWDESCDSDEGLTDEMAGLSLMSPSGFSTVLTNLQKNKARDFALTVPPNSGPSGANCPTVVTDNTVEVIGTPPPPKAVGCGCTMTGTMGNVQVAVGIGLVAAATRRRRRRNETRFGQGDDRA